ncbi:MAG: SDR family oxidoreductase [Novosphingobium sp.]
MPDANKTELDMLNRVLPDIVGTRLLLIGAGGIGMAVANLARDLGVSIAVANRSTPKLDAVKAAMPDVETHQINARSQESVNAVLDATMPDHVVLSTGYARVMQSGGTDLAVATDYVGDRLEPIIAVANWSANSAKKLRSITVISGYIGTPIMGNMGWSMASVAIKGLIEHLAVELGPTRVNAVAPGPVIDTAMARLAAGSSEGLDGMAKALSAKLPIKRPVTGDDVAREALYVAGNPTATGSIRFAEGGLSLIPNTLLSADHLDH